jgi:hypothetical protein
VLGADVVYEPAHAALIPHVLAALLRPGTGRALLALQRDHEGFHPFEALLEGGVVFFLTVLATVVYTHTRAETAAAATTAATAHRRDILVLGGASGWVGRQLTRHLGAHRCTVTSRSRR